MVFLCRSGHPVSLLAFPGLVGKVAGLVLGVTPTQDHTLTDGWVVL